MTIAVQEPTDIAFKKTRTPWRKAAGRLLNLSAAVAASMAVSLPASADWLDALNPMNLLKGEKYETKVVPDVPPEDLYNQALAKLQSKDYDGAAKKFAEIDKHYPYSQWQRKALLMTTFSQYQNGSYDDAIASAKRYITLFVFLPRCPLCLLP